MATVAVETLPSGTIQIEVDAEPDDDLEAIYGDLETREALAEKVVRLGRPLFSEALDLVHTCAAAVHERVAAMGDITPDEVEMQLAVKLDAKVGAKLVELTGGAQLQVTLRWRKPA
jgi:NAD(P)-dependent dehydrogenase (short-subunit alcohol dehydrogenase family)